MHSLPGIILLYLAKPFYTEGVFAWDSYVHTVQLISNFMLASTESRVSTYFSRALYWNSCSITQLACLITKLTCLSLLIVSGLLVCTRALTQVACIANTLRVLIVCYVFTWVRHVHYLSSSNSPVNVRIGIHIRKGRGLILLVTRPAVINHLSAIYTEFYFC